MAGSVSCDANENENEKPIDAQDKTHLLEPALAGTRPKARRVLPRILSQRTAVDDYTGEWRTYTWKTASHVRSDRSRT